MRRIIDNPSRPLLLFALSLVLTAPRDPQRFRLIQNRFFLNMRVCVVLPDAVDVGAALFFQVIAFEYYDGNPTKYYIYLDHGTKFQFQIATNNKKLS